MAYRLGNRILKIDNKLFYAEGAAPVNPVWSGLTSYWRFNEGSGTSVADAKNAYNGTMSNTSGFNRSGKNGTCMSLTGGTYCSYGTFNTWTTSQPYTFSCWLKLDYGGSGVVPILSNLNASVSCIIDPYFFEANGNLMFYIMYNNNVGRCAISIANMITDKNWHFVVGSYNGDRNPNNMKAYLDGTLKSKTGSVNSLSYTGALGTTLCTNGRNMYPYTCNSMIDEIGLWNRVLSQDEVTALYNAGNGLFY